MAHRRQNAIARSELVSVVAELAAARLRSGMSQRELSRRLDLHDMTVMRLELGRRDLTLIEFVDLAREIGEEPWELLRRALGGGDSRQPTRNP